MEILEFGDKSKKKMILIHGFQSPWQIWEKYIERYQSDFHLIVPVMSGHNPEKKEDFVSFFAEAKTLEEYIVPRCGKEIEAVFGMSMGGVLAATLWQDSVLHINKIIFDGSPLTSLNGMMKKMMTGFYLNVTHQVRQRKPKTIEQAVNTVIPREYLDAFLAVLDNMSDTTIENCIAGIAAFQQDRKMSASDTAITFFHGTASDEMLAKKSAKLLKRRFPQTDVRCFKGKAHCENSLFHPDIMIGELDGILY